MSPLLVKTIKIEQFVSDEVIEAKATSYEIDPQMAKALGTYQALKISCKGLAHLGGSTGLIYKNILASSQTNTQIWQIKDPTQELINIDDGIRSLQIKSKMPRLTQIDLDQIYLEYAKSLQFASTSQIINVSNDENIISGVKNLIRISKKDKIILGIYLRENIISQLIGEKPSLILVDRKSLEAYSQMEISTNFQISKICKEIIDLGVEEILYVGDKGDLSLYSRYKNYRAYHRDLTSIDKDKVLAGYLSKNTSEAYTDRLALALASALRAGSSDATDLGAPFIKKNLQDIEVRSFNVSR